MSKLNLKFINYPIAVVFNVPLFLIPLIMLLFWHLGAYSKSNEDGYSVVGLVTGVVVLDILPFLAVSIFLLVRANKERKKGANNLASARMSAIYGLLASIFLGVTWLVMEPTWW